ncbi:hypothetical protein CSOJ01_01245 [Colletotrichum sojae]|uniref:Uncharacterized protein n=1 Tax=Colletotrichum sojae TaxID=2175907 RepID=A0A8H6JUU1_9PEZI|nr:hypothetical protein CSOJ01_01245 [Colletotrichum sojae]
MVFLLKGDGAGEDIAGGLMRRPQRPAGGGGGGGGTPRVRRGGAGSFAPVWGSFHLTLARADPHPLVRVPSVVWFNFSRLALAARAAGLRPEGGEQGGALSASGVPRQRLRVRVRGVREVRRAR